MRARGIDSPESLLGFADAAAILATCEWWDGLKGVGVGLLVKKIREGGVEPEEAPVSAAERKQQERRARLEELRERFPVGSVTEAHLRYEMRRHADYPDPCAGRLVVIENRQSALEVRCDACGFEAAYPLRATAVLPPAPLAVGQPIPPRRRIIAPPPGAGGSNGSSGGLRRVRQDVFGNSQNGRTSPFAGSRLAPDRLAAETATFLAMFRTAVDAEADDQEKWAYYKMKETYAAIMGIPPLADGEIPPGLWQAMNWAAAQS
jgi:hypothetical protein